MPGTHLLRHAGLDKADEESEVVERLDGFGGSGDQRFGGGDFLPQSPELGHEPVAGVAGGQRLFEQVQRHPQVRGVSETVADLDDIWFGAGAG
jgi:hypothetical protein